MCMFWCADTIFNLGGVSVYKGYVYLFFEHDGLLLTLNCLRNSYQSLFSLAELVRSPALTEERLALLCRSFWLICPPPSYSTKLPYSRHLNRFIPSPRLE